MNDNDLRKSTLGSEYPAWGCGFELLFAIPAVLTLRGVVIRDLWGWFVVPLGVQPLWLTQAMGISVFAALLTHFPKLDDEKPNWARAKRGMVVSITIPLFAWGLGWVLVWLATR